LLSLRPTAKKPSAGKPTTTKEEEQMSGMYDDKPGRFEGKLDPYPHSELGVEVRRRRRGRGRKAVVAVVAVAFLNWFLVDPGRRGRARRALFARGRGGICCRPLATFDFERRRRPRRRLALRFRTARAL
jgi:hypothetical protein